MKTLKPIWNQHTVVRPFANDFDPFFDNFFQGQGQNNFRPSYVVEESEKYFLISFDLPGMDEKDFNLELEKQHLTLSGTRSRKQIKDDVSQRNFGITYGEFKKSFRLPDNVSSENVEADYKQGVLKVLLPKNEKEKPKKIEVQSKKGSLFNQFFKDDQSA